MKHRKGHLAAQNSAIMVVFLDKAAKRLQETAGGCVRLGYGASGRTLRHRPHQRALLEDTSVAMLSLETI